MRGSILLAAVVLGGCTSASPWEPVQWKQLSASERQSHIDRITKTCGLQSDRVKQLEGEEISVQPHADDDYNKVDCLLRGLNSLKGAKLGFIGNEAYIGNEQ